MDATQDSGDKITPKPTFQAPVDLLIWAIIAIQIIVGIYGFIVLPDTVPIHWGVNGQANGYGPKWIDTFLFPLISIGIYVLIRVLLAAGPRLGGRQATVANLQIAKIIIAAVILFMLVIQLATIAQSLGAGFDMTTVVMLAISILFIFIGNYMGKMRRNFWMSAPCRRRQALASLPPGAQARANTVSPWWRIWGGPPSAGQIRTWPSSPPVASLP